MEIEPRWVANRPGHYTAATEDLAAACDENTIGELVATAGPAAHRPAVAVRIVTKGSSGNC
jgi:glutamate/tyrosine decarboxylase-like PLP-dependent enzyme